MKKYLFILTIAIITGTVSTAQPLPTVAQALYDEAWHHDSSQVIYATSHGAAIKATPDGNSFYVQWFPSTVTPATAPLIVTLHGSSGYAFAEFYNWYSYAQAHGCGLIALQWYRGIATTPPNDYFNDTILYRDIDTALTRFGYIGKAFLHGFSRGAARSYAVMFLDAHGGKNYFCTALSNAGSAQSTYPLYAAINAGTYGTNVFAGKKWALFCGGHDTDYLMSGCPGMTNTQTWLNGQGATVGMFIQDTALPHAGFHTIPAYMDSVINYYMSCYNATAIKETENSAHRLDIFPNPFHDNISIHTANAAATCISVTIRNLVGTLLYSEKEAATAGPYTKTINLGFLSPGTYLLETEADGVQQKKIVVKQ